ncbi:hypothetical protein D3C75_1035720 [compost metagenome]
MARLRIYGSEYRIETIRQRGDDVEILFSGNMSEQVDQKKLAVCQQSFENRIRPVPGSLNMMIMKGKGLTPEQSIGMLERFLVQYKEALKPKGELENVSNS